MEPGATGGILPGLLGGFLTKDPAKAGMSYYQQIPGMITPYFNPYVQEGRRDLSALHGQVMGMLDDPSAILAQIGSKYKQSPGYQFQVNQATQAANRAAAAGGMAGSPAEQTQLSARINQLANQDYGDYMNRALGLRSQGLSGLEGLNALGYNAASTLAGDLASNQMNMGNLAMQQAKMENARRGGLLSGLGSVVGDIAGFL